MSDQSTPEIEELIGAYALDAVDGEERAAVEQHLAVCVRCRAELAEHREVAAMLAYEGEPAPTDVWDRIVVSLEEPPPAMRLRLEAPDDVVTLDDRRRARRQRGFYVAVAGVAAALALILGVVVVRQNDDEVSPVALPALVDEARATPGSTTATLRSASGQGGPEAVAIVTPDGRGYLEAGDLPPLPADRTYQLWGVVDDQAISLGVLGTNPDIAAFHVDDANRVAAYAITDEVAGGVITSQNQPVVVGQTA
jgi:hypothetical protein